MDDLPAAKLAFLQQDGLLKGYLAAKKRFLLLIPDNNRSLAPDFIH